MALTIMILISLAFIIICFALLWILHRIGIINDFQNRAWDFSKGISKVQELESDSLELKIKINENKIKMNKATIIRITNHGNETDEELFELKNALFKAFPEKFKNPLKEEE